MSAKDVADAVNGVLLQHLDSHGGRELGIESAAELWDRLSDLGMTAIDVPEHAGGGGGQLEEALEVVRQCGYHNANLPIVDAGIVGTWLRGLVGLPPASRPDGVALDERGDLNLVGEADDLSLSGELTLGWGRSCGELLVVRENAFGTQLLRVEPSSLAEARWALATNMGGEPRDLVTLTEVPAISVPGFPVTFMQVRARWSLGSAAQMLGALEKVTELAIEQVRTREQFGRPLSKFQVIQHYIATMVAQVASVRAAVEKTASTAATDGTVDIAAAAAAKIRAGGAAAVVTSLGHQVHGAIGVTHEHALGRSTRRLWAWRDENGDEQFWAQMLGRNLASQAHGSGLWAALEPVG